MIQILIIAYIAVLLIPIIKRKNNWFSPPVLMSITMTFYTVPDLISILVGGYKTYVNNLPFQINTDQEYLLERFLIIQLIYISVYYISFYKSSNNKKVKYTPFQIKRENSSVTFAFGVTLLLICGIETYQFIIDQGGISELYLSFTNRSQLHENQTIIQCLLPSFMTFATIFCMRYILSNNRKNIILLIPLILIGFFCYTSDGGRSQLIVFVLSILCCYNYWKSKINLLAPKFYILYFVLAFFLIAFQLLRFKDTNTLTSEVILNNQSTLFDSMAYVKTQLLIENYFDKFDLWYGYIFYFIFYIFIPRSIYPDKPQIDEGGYIFNMIDGHPNVLNDKVFINSWPPFTIGEGYANFGIVGVIIFAFLLAKIHSYVYRLLKFSKSTLFIMPIFIFVILKFQITIFYIANLSYLIVATLIFYKIYKFICRVFITSKVNSKRNIG